MARTSVYPDVLQAIVRHESSTAATFWIIHAPENDASRAGIRKAGFQSVGGLAFHLKGGAGIAALGDSERLAIGALLLGLTPTDHYLLSLCWACAAAGPHAVYRNEKAPLQRVRVFNQHCYLLPDCILTDVL